MRINPAFILLGCILVPIGCILVPEPSAQTTIVRDAHGRIARSFTAKAAFKQAHPCPATHRPTGRCPGYIVDHVIALKRGGPDTPANMQWQTVKEAKEKDRWE